MIVPFRNEKLIGVVTGLSAKAPADFEVRYLEAVLDEEPLLSEPLLALAEWMAQYYLAPLGEVLRGMLPLMAEVRRTVYYRITDLGRDVLAESVEGRRGRLPGLENRDLGHPDLVSDTRLLRSAKGGRAVSAEEQDLERRVLARLASGEPVKVSTLRTATAATLPVLAGLTRKKWIARETAAVERDARRTERFAVLIPEARLPALTAKQQAILAELAACDGELPLAELRRKDLPSSTLQTLVRRGLVRIDERPAVFRLGGLQSQPAPLRLNEPQMDALASLATALGGFHPFLLHGVTGSGKTAVYLAAMQRALDRGLASILLVPEIGLTPQTVGLLDAAFGDKVALLHSALTPEERSEQWRRIRRGEAPIVVGTRSAIFAPAPNLGLILVDEEHDQSYKQEETPRYNARDVAVMRAKIEGAVVVMGSATPSLESWQNSAAGKYQRIEMRDRVMNRPLPEVELIDMRREFQETGQEQLFSRALVEQTQAGSGSRRAGADPAQPARLLVCRDLPRLRRKAGVPELRHLADPPQAAGGGCRRGARGPAAGVPLLRLPAHGAGALPQVRQRAPLLSGRGLAAGRRAAGRDLSHARASAAWTATRCAGAAIWNGCWRGCTRARSTCWWARR